MSDSGDMACEAITDSAKTRFDYSTFAHEFDGLGSEATDNLLFKIILELSDGTSPADIAASISRDLVLQGGGVDERLMQEFIEARSQDLQAEIHATHFMLGLLEMGATGPGLLVQIRSLLEKSKAPSNQPAEQDAGDQASAAVE